MSEADRCTCGKSFDDMVPVTDNDGVDSVQCPDCNSLWYDEHSL